MAVVKTSQESRIGIKVVNGVNASGANVFKTLSFSNVKAAALDQDLYDVAASIAGLQSKSLVEIVRTDQANLSGE